MKMPLFLDIAAFPPHSNLANLASPLQATKEFVKVDKLYLQQPPIYQIYLD
jgi:hypothetical protein